MNCILTIFLKIYIVINYKTQIYIEATIMKGGKNLNSKLRHLTLQLENAVENPNTTIQEIFNISCIIDQEIFSTIQSNKQTNLNIQANKITF